MSSVWVAPTAAHNPWSIAAADFPAAGSPSDKLRFVLRYAVLAPSTRNTQPWLWKIRAGSGIETLDLYADRSRAMPRIDPGDRELTMSCGAALLHLRLALRHFNWNCVVEILPDPDDPDLLARVRLGNSGGRGSPEAAVADNALFEMIVKRRTNRLVFEDRALPSRLLGVLQESAAQEGAWLYFLEGTEARGLAADLIEVGDRIQWSDKLARYQMAAWIRPRGHRSSDGIPASAFDPDDALSNTDPSALPAINIGAQQAVRDRRLAEATPALAVLGTDADSPGDWLAAGQALGRVLLRARAAGVWASYLNQPVEVPALRPQLRDVLNRILGRPGFPQLLFRLGYGPDVPPTPRRPVQDVLL